MKQNAPGARSSEGVVCAVQGNVDVYSTAAARVQHLARIGLPFRRASLLAPLIYGEAL
jgi:hypothetical protein